MQNMTYAINIEWKEKSRGVNLSTHLRGLSRLEAMEIASIYEDCDKVIAVEVIERGTN